MIELTLEMERAMYEALAAEEPGRHHAAVRAGLTAVLAIVERDHLAKPACVCLGASWPHVPRPNPVWPQDGATDVTYGDTAPNPGGAS